MRIFNVFGYSNTGKTYLIEKLLQRLNEENYTLGYLKLTKHKGPFDKEGKDTFRTFKKGAKRIGLLHSEGFVIWRYDGNIRDESMFIREHFNGVHYLIIEGKTNLAVPKIKCLGDGDKVEDDHLILGYCSMKGDGFLHPEKDFRVIYNMVREKSMPLLPHIDCGECGYPTCKDFAVDYLSGRVKLSDCKILSENAVIVRVSGKRIEIKSFVQEFLGNTILGALSSLRGFEPNGEIVIKINPEAILFSKESKDKEIKKNK